MAVKPSSVKLYKKVCYLPSIVLFIIASIYCVMVYLSGEIGGANAGYKNLVGIPNYYFFYTSIFPFITAGIIYIATQNINIRFFGELNKEMDKDRLNKILFHRKLLLFIAIVFSLLVTINDASEKGRTLPPYSLSFSSDKIQAEVTIKYFELRDLENQQRKNKREDKHKEKAELTENTAEKKTERNFEDEYFEFITEKGYQGKSVTGFNSFSSWYNNSSFNYKIESFLSWVAALVISVFVAQFFLIIMVKEHIVSETKNLVLWILILCSFWIPCKIFSVYYYSLQGYQPPAIVWFSIILLVISIVLALFIKVEKNDMSKYATVVGGVFSVLVTTVSVFKPEYFEIALNVLQQLSWMYGGILMFVIAFSIYLVTDHLINIYEKSKFAASDHIIDSSDTAESG